jgi:hypothetical protein
LALSWEASIVTANLLSLGMIRQRSECQLYASEMLEEASFMELELFRKDLYLTGKLLVLQVAPVSECRRS